MNQIEIFNSPEFGSIRTLEQNGKVLFCGTDVASPYELLQTPPTRYMMPCSDWKKISLHRKIRSLHGMAKLIHLKHGMRIRPYSLQ